MDSIAWALLTDGEDLYAGGQLELSGDRPVRGVAVWDGQDWQEVGAGGVDGSVDSLVSLGRDLYAFGTFTSTGGVPVRNVARWDGTAWHDVAGGVNRSVWTSVAYEGDLILGGNLTEAGGSISAFLARLDLEGPPQDLNDDHLVDFRDVVILLAYFGTPGGATPDQGDLESDGDVDLDDLTAMLNSYGTSCP